MRAPAARAERALHDRAGFARWLDEHLPERGLRHYWSEHPSVDVLARYLNAVAAWAFEVEVGRARVRTIGAAEWQPLPTWTRAWLQAAYERREVVEGDGTVRSRVTRAAALAALEALATSDTPESETG